MRSPAKLPLLFALFAVLTSAGWTQDAPPAARDQGASATKEEVQQLRQEVADQRKTIEELRALVQQLVDAKTTAAGAPRLVNATMALPSDSAEAAQAPKP